MWKLSTRLLGVCRERGLLGATAPRRCRVWCRGIRPNSSVKSLHAAFRNPSSPFYLAPGKRGPSHEDDHDPEALPAAPISTIESSRGSHGDSADSTRSAVVHEAAAELSKLGYDPASFWEQSIVWGDHDSFQHVNNVRYLRFFESGRIKWMMSLGQEFGGESKAADMVKGRGVSLILKSVSLNYMRPVTFPDTLLIAHKPIRGSTANPSHPPNGESKGGGEVAARRPRTHFHMKAVAWSYAQRRIVTESDSVLVWYDYDKLGKCSPGEDMLRVLDGRMRLCGEA